MTEPMRAGQVIKVGQIWKEVDDRFDRSVIVKGIFSESIHIRSVVKDRKLGWVPAPRSRDVQAMTARFNGKRGGYKLIEDVREVVRALTPTPTEGQRG